MSNLVYKVRLDLADQSQLMRWNGPIQLTCKDVKMYAQRGSASNLTDFGIFCIEKLAKKIFRCVKLVDTHQGRLVAAV